VEEALGVQARIEVRRQTGTTLPTALPERVLGAVWFEERTLFVNAEQGPGRRRFTLAHELAHVVCPWHEAVLRTDTADELFGALGARIEAEANFGASEMIFQGHRFAVEARLHDRSLATAFALAERFGASRQAAAHQYVAGHEAPMALAIAGRWPGRDGRLPVWQSVESASFLSSFGRFAHGGGIATREGADAPFALAIDAARRSSEPVADHVRLRDRSGALHRFRSDVFNNRHCNLIFVAAAGRHR
jgi:hypothetical protein